MTRKKALPRYVVLVVLSRPFDLTPISYCIYNKVVIEQGLQLCSIFESRQDSLRKLDLYPTWQDSRISTWPPVAIGGGRVNSAGERENPRTTICKHER